MSTLRKLRQRRGLLDALINITWLGSDRILRMLGGVIVGTTVARYLGPDNFGILSYALAIYTLFNIVSNLGLDSLVVRDVALNPHQEPEILGTAFYLKVGASIVTTFVAIIATLILSPGNHLVLMIVTLMSIASISQSLDVIEFFFQAKVQSRWSVVPRTIVFVLASVARLAAVIQHRSLIVFGWIAAIEVLLSEIGLGIAYLQYKKPIPVWNLSWRRGVSLLRESWPLMMAAVMYIIFMRTDQVMLGRMAGPDAAGEYTAAARISEVWYTVPILICNSVLPKLLIHKESAPHLYFGRLQQLYNMLTVLSTGLAICTSFLSPLAIHLLYGEAYKQASTVLSVHIWSGVFVCVGVVGAGQLIHERLTRLELQRCVMGAVVNILLNWLLIPRYGAVGSAYATLCTHAVTSYLADIFNSATRPIFKMKTRALLGFGLLYRPAALLRKTS